MNPYELGLIRLDHLIAGMRERLDRLERDEAVIDFFPSTLDTVENIIVALERAREVVDPDFILWLRSSDSRSKAHAVRDVTTMQSLCGRSMRGSKEDQSWIRCTICTNALYREQLISNLMALPDDDL